MTDSSDQSPAAVAPDVLRQRAGALPDLYLMRHGETRWNAQSRLQGQLDSPLTARGRAQARWQADLIAGIAGQRLASPQGRAVETARLVFGAQTFQTCADLAEIGMGEFTGQRLDLLRRDHGALFRGAGLGWYDRIPGGEGFATLATRCHRLLTTLEGPALIVSHGITLRMIWALALGRDVSQLAEAPVDQGRVLVIRNGQTALWRHVDDEE